MLIYVFTRNVIRSSTKQRKKKFYKKNKDKVLLALNRFRSVTYSIFCCIQRQTGNSTSRKKQSFFYERKGTTEPKRQGVEKSPKTFLSQITGSQIKLLGEKLICHGDLNII